MSRDAISSRKEKKKKIFSLAALAFHFDTEGLYCAASGVSADCEPSSKLLFTTAGKKKSKRFAVLGHHWLPGKSDIDDKKKKETHSEIANSCKAIKVTE